MTSTSNMGNSTMSSFMGKSQLFTTFNSNHKLGQHRIHTIRKTGEMLVESDRVCQKIWNDMRSTDVTPKEAMSAETFAGVFQKSRANITDIMGVLSAKDLFELVDEDNDGFLNEDEQILLFSLIKARMQRASKDLLMIYDYQLFHELMSKIRRLERLITDWQNQLRCSIYTGELQRYREIGSNKLEEFFAKYEKRYQEFKQLRREKLEDFDRTRMQKRLLLDQDLEKDSNTVKFKPKRQLRDYQTQERLVALEERIEEATNFRKELKDLEVNEVNRLSKLWMQFKEAEFKKFDIETQKLLSHLLVKLKNDENKLVIKLNKEFDVLKKKIALHENDIKRIQTLNKKKAIAKGRNKGEIYRLKETLRYQNDIIQKSKKVKASLRQQSTQASGLGGGSSMSPRDPARLSRKSILSNSRNLRSPETVNGRRRLPAISTGAPERTKNVIRRLQKLKKQPDLIRFYIRHKFKDEIPENAKLKSYQQGDDDHFKVEKYLVHKEKEDDGVLKLTNLYDDFLDPKSTDETRRLLREPEPQPETRERKELYHMLGFNPQRLR